MHVVIVAYGHRATTRRAIGRARGWGDVVSGISVVPAGPVCDLRPGAFDGITIATDLGTAGIRAVAGSDPVLIVHDDVALDAVGVGRLAEALQRADHAVAVDPGHSTPGAACVATRAIRSITTPLALPSAHFAARTGDIVTLDIGARHEKSCRTALVEDHLDPEHPLLVASMIVKDEEHCLPEALASMVGLVDRIDICDTGSSDGTLEIIRRHGAQVREVEWRNDFAWARNQALEMSRDATFALIVDADERIVCADVPRFRRWVRSWAHEFDAASIRVENDQPHGATSNAHSIRMSRPTTSTYTGAIHELPSVTHPDGESPGRIVTDIGMSLHHVGYRADIVAERGKHQRNIDIARIAHEAEPSARTAIDLARSLLAADDTNREAAALFEIAAAELGPDATPAAHSYVAASRARHAHLGGDHERAVQLAQRAIEHTPNEDIALVTAAASLLALGREDELIALHTNASRRPPGTPLFSVARNVSRYQVMVGIAHIRSGSPAIGLEMLEETMRHDAVGVADVVAAVVPDLLVAGMDPSSLTGVISCDATGQVARALASQVPPTTTSSICLGSLLMGEPHPPVVAIQLTAALVGGAHDLVDAGLVFADRLDPDARRRMIALAQRKKRNDIAEKLTSGDGNRVQNRRKAGESMPRSSS